MLNTLLPLRAMVVTLKFTRAASLPFFHQAALTAFLRHLLDSPPEYDLKLCIDAPESGRIDYQLGANYRFTVFCLPTAQVLLATLAQRLAQLPSSAKKTGPKLHFCDNLQLVALHDLWQGHAVGEWSELTPWTPTAESQLWRYAQGPLTLRWLTPARVLKRKPKDEKKRPAKGDERFCRGDDDLDISLWLTRLYDSTASLLRRLGHAPAGRPHLPTMIELEQHQFWLDTNYQGPKGQSKTMGGISGMVVFKGPIPEAWLTLLIIAQYLGVGQHRTFGWGRYRIEAQDGSHTLSRAEPASSLLKRARQLDNLQTAAQTISANSQSGKNYASQPDKIEWLSEKLPLWQPAILQGVVINKANGDPRALAIAPVADRIQQRAVAQILTPAIDRLLSSSSYGYRRGLSRRNAAEAIQLAWREGYRWVYESDIDDFFDNVQRDHLAHRLHSLFPDEPLIPLVLAWMAAPVEWDNNLVERPQGVPQGSPLSPLLTNLLLDDFDRDMEDAGFRMIRFADDFVVACKSPEQAQQADQLVRRSLADLKLEINQDKTHTRSFEQGFRYLGYLFMNDLVVQSKGQTRVLPKPQEAPAWMVNIGSKALHKIEPDGQLQAPQKPIPAPIEEQPKSSALHMGDMDDAGTLVLISGEPTLISSRDGQVWVTRDDQDINRTPWAHITAVIIIGRHHMTTPALVHAMEQEVSVHFLGRGGQYKGAANSAASATAQVSMWNKQQQAFANLHKTLPLAQAVVSSRIRHMREMLRLQPSTPQISDIRDALKADLQKVTQTTNNASLNGIEGSATRRYYKALQLIIPPQWQFTGRNRRPPTDPVNAMLSLGYTLLYSHTDSMLRIAGLMPWSGFYHQPHGSHATLASDLMEPFRHLVERTVLTVIKRKQLSPDDFSQHETQGVQMSQEAQKIYLTQLEKRFLIPVKVKGQSTGHCLHGHLHQQNMSLKQCLNNISEFNAFLLR